MSGFILLPNYVAAEIDARLDAAIAEVPAAEKDREHLRGQLIDFFSEHGVVPDFSLARNQDQSK